jgi:hypothetical protein
MDFEILGKVAGVETIATGSGFVKKAVCESSMAADDGANAKALPMSA